MSRRRQTTCPEPEELEPTLDISSLIDVCFLLLIYFLVTSAMLPRQAEIGMKLPSLSSSVENNIEMPPLELVIDAEGAVSLGSGQNLQSLDQDLDQRELPLLLSQLRLYSEACLATNSSPSVKLSVSDEASQQRLMDVLNAISQVNITQIHFVDWISS